MKTTTAAPSPKPARRSRTSSSATIHGEIQRLAAAMLNGRLDERGNVAALSGEDADLIALVNRMLDTLVSPLRLAAHTIDEIAHGRIPAFVIDDYQGEYNHLKQNINTLLATLYGLHSETQHLIGSINEGNLKTRGNDWDFEGVWRELIGGVNGTLDAVITPINEAGTVLKRLAAYDLGARMQGKYHGDHAAIKKAMNATAESLHTAVSQVAETVELVSTVGSHITHSSEVVSRGAFEQERQLSESAETLEHISESSHRSAQNTLVAQTTAQKAAAAISTAKTAMEGMLGTMSEIRTSADNTAAIIQEIDAIAKQTESISTSAADKAVRVRSSAGGFGVVAKEIRTFSLKCEDAVKRLEDFYRQILEGMAFTDEKIGEQLKTEFEFFIKDLDKIASQSGLLGVNAAIEAAHVEGAGHDFEALTEEIRNLAQHSTDAATKSDSLIKCSTDLARKGEEYSLSVVGHLASAVEGAQTIVTLTEEITEDSHQQASAIEELSCTVTQINEVTRLNATSAHESSTAAKDLDRQVKKLSATVSKFRLDSAAA